MTFLIVYESIVFIWINVNNDFILFGCI